MRRENILRIGIAGHACRGNMPGDVPWRCRNTPSVTSLLPSRGGVEDNAWHRGGVPVFARADESLMRSRPRDCTPGSGRFIATDRVGDTCRRNAFRGAERFHSRF